MGGVVFSIGSEAMYPQNEQAQVHLSTSPSQALVWQVRFYILFPCIKLGLSTRVSREDVGQGQTGHCGFFLIVTAAWALWSLQGPKLVLTGEASRRLTVSEADGLRPCLLPKPSGRVCHRLKPGGWHDTTKPHVPWGCWFLGARLLWDL